LSGLVQLFSSHGQSLFTGTLQLTLILLMCRIWWAPNNGSNWQIGYNFVFKGLRFSSLVFNWSTFTVVWIVGY
jgi:hypothetical protein